MTKPINVLFQSIGALAIVVSLTTQASAMSNMSDIQNESMKPVTQQQTVLNSSNEISPEHWSYKLMQKLVDQTGLDNSIKLDGNRPLTRTEMGILIADLSGMVKQNDVSRGMSDYDKAQFDVLKTEFQSELNVLSARIQKVEDSVEYLSSQVKKGQDDTTKYVSLNKFGPAKLSGMIQAWDTIAFDDGQTQKNFRMRRSEFGVKGKLIKDFEYGVMFDLATSGDVTRDLYMDYTGLPHHKLRIGQYKPGTTYEVNTSSSQLDFIERSQIGQLADVRDVGFSVYGEWKYLDYQAGIFNGALTRGTTTSGAIAGGGPDANTRTALSGRVTVRPFVDWMNEKKWGKFELGSSLHDGQAGVTGGITEVDRWGLEARWINPHFKLAGEFLQNQTGEVDGNGWYVSGLVNLNPKWQVGFRYDTRDPDLSIATNRRSVYTAGINYLLESYNIKLALNYLYMDDQTDVNEGSAVQLLTQYIW